MSIEISKTEFGQLVRAYVNNKQSIELLSDKEVFQVFENMGK
jgi:hypothetical protein